MTHRTYSVYILANRSGMTYVGVTNNLSRRVGEHKAGVRESFSRNYNITKLVYAEEFGSIEEAILREKQIKSWKREKKAALITGANPQWLELSSSL
jgi:putative endonuclease